MIYLELSLFQFPWRWYVSECEIETGGDVLFFGFINGYFDEWGFFQLSELEDTRCPLLVSYDFKPMPFSELKKNTIYEKEIVFRSCLFTARICFRLYPGLNFLGFRHKSTA